MPYKALVQYQKYDKSTMSKICQKTFNWYNQIYDLKYFVVRIKKTLAKVSFEKKWVWPWGDIKGFQSKNN